MKQKTQAKPKLPTPVAITRRPPMLRSAYWAWLLGAIGGAICGAWQVRAMSGGPFWITVGALLGLPLGLIAGCDLLIPGPGPDSGFMENRGNRVGPFRWGVLIGLVAVEGLLIGLYLWGDSTLLCERQPTQVVCRSLTRGWLNSRPTGETVYDDVVGVALDVRNELLLRHGPAEQSRVVPGFGADAMTAVEAFLVDTKPTLTVRGDSWLIYLGPPICLLLALLAGIWGWLSIQNGLRILHEQFAHGEIYRGWRKR